MEILVVFGNKLLNWKIKYLQIYFLWDIVHVTTFLTVMTILFTAAADRSSPLGWSTRVMPRWWRLKVMPSKIVSRVSVQFSGSSGDKWKRTNSVCINLFNQSCVAGLKQFYSWCAIVSRSKVLVFQSNHFNSKKKCQYAGASTHEIWSTTTRRKHAFPRSLFQTIFKFIPFNGQKLQEIKDRESDWVTGGGVLKTEG